MKLIECSVCKNPTGYVICPDCNLRNLAKTQNDQKEMCKWFYDRGNLGGLAHLGFEENWKIYMNEKREIKAEEE